MCRHSVSCLNGIAFVGLLASALTCALSYCAPFWLFYPSFFNNPPVFPLIPIASKSYPFVKASFRGLWAVCFRDGSCLWFWENGFTAQKSLPVWYIAVQCVFGMALVLFVFAIMIQSVYSCCRSCDRASPCPTVVGSFTIAAGILAGAALTIYGGFSHKEGEFDPDVIVDSRGAQLDWAFYVGIAGSGAAIFSAILFYADGCRIRKNYGSYSKPPTIKN